jgi:hypothetical protein
MDLYCTEAHRFFPKAQRWQFIDRTESEAINNFAAQNNDRRSWFTKKDAKKRLVVI